MKIPKYIDEALKQRTRYASKLDNAMATVDRWLDANGIECETCDTHTGCEIYANPYASEQRIREAIKLHDKGDSAND